MLPYLLSTDEESPEAKHWPDLLFSLLEDFNPHIMRVGRRREEREGKQPTLCVAMATTVLFALIFKGNNDFFILPKSLRKENSEKGDMLGWKK